MIADLTSNAMWLRIFDHAGAALAYSTATVVLGWLGMRKYVGHRTLLLHAALFAALRSVLSVTLMVSTYRVDHTSRAVTLLLTMSTVVGISFATYLMFCLNDLLFTFTHAEANEMLRQDRSVDTQQEHMLYQFMAAENRNASARFLASNAVTEVNRG